MNELDRTAIQALLRDALPPAGSRELKQDLWPLMLGRLDQRPRRWAWADFAFAAAAAAGLLAVPEAIPWVLFHL
jgi:hypothetical protein